MLMVEKSDKFALNVKKEKKKANNESKSDIVCHRVIHILSGRRRAANAARAVIRKSNGSWR